MKEITQLQHELSIVISTTAELSESTEKEALVNTIQVYLSQLLMMTRAIQDMAAAGRLRSVQNV